MERLSESIRRAECTPSLLLSSLAIGANNLLCLGYRSPSVEARSCYCYPAQTCWTENPHTLVRKQRCWRASWNSREYCPRFLFYFWVISLVECKWNFLTNWPCFSQNFDFINISCAPPVMVKNLRLLSNGQMWTPIQTTTVLACLISPHCQPGVMSSDRITRRACPCSQPLAGCWVHV